MHGLLEGFLYGLYDFTAFTKSTSQIGHDGNNPIHNPEIAYFFIMAFLRDDFLIHVHLHLQTKFSTASTSNTSSSSSAWCCTGAGTGVAAGAVACEAQQRMVRS